LGSVACDCIKLCVGSHLANSCLAECRTRKTLRVCKRSELVLLFDRCWKRTEKPPLLRLSRQIDAYRRIRPLVGFTP
jgi:hypothetical protein